MNSKTRVVAGHTFDDNDNDPVCACGRTWSEIENVTEDQEGQHGIAHTMHVTKSEIQQIAAERERRAAKRAAIWEAVCGVAAK